LAKKRRHCTTVLNSTVHIISNTADESLNNSTTQRQNNITELKKLSITFAMAVISRSGVLGYQSGSGVLLLAGVALTAQTGGTFSLLLKGDGNRRDRGFPVRLPASPPGEATLLIKNPPPERSVRPVLLISLCSGILEICKIATRVADR
jgi:hypothetical protein